MAWSSNSLSEHLPVHGSHTSSASALERHAAAPPDAGDQSLAAVRKEHILRIFAACNNNRTDAARVLGIDRKTLYRALLRWGVSGLSSEGEP
jgi:transcriptional regulator of acetoin/glycerol metabolism